MFIIPHRYNNNLTLSGNKNNVKSKCVWILLRSVGLECIHAGGSDILQSWIISGNADSGAISIAFGEKLAYFNTEWM